MNRTPGRPVTEVEADVGHRPPLPGAVGPATFERFYAGAAARLVTQLFMVTGHLEDAQDCVQEAFARAWLRWETFQREIDDPYAWVYTVAYRTAMSRFRRRAAFVRALRRTAPPPGVPGPGPEVVAVRDALATLPAGQRAALVLHYYAGVPVEGVARTLGISPSGVKSRLARGRAALAPLLADDPDVRRETGRV